MPVAVTYRFSDYRQLEGIRIPYRVEAENAFTGRMIVEYERVTANVEQELVPIGS